jgi:type IV/VI secretion system ImpK/VasF family protein
MTDDSENDFGNGGNSDVPGSDRDRVDDLDQPRPFRSWAAREQVAGPSVWTRMRGRLVSMFSRRGSDRSVANGREIDEGVTAVDDPVSPPDDFKFPWTRPAEAPFESVDAALPAEQAKGGGGFFSRLLGKRDSPDRTPEESDVHQGRIDAAADALEEVGGNAFDAPASDATPERDFATVDQALPLLDLTAPRAPARNAVDLIAPVDITERKTDEFETVVASLEPPRSDQLDEDTLQVSKKTFIARLLGFGKSEEVKKQDSTATVVDANPAFLFAKYRAFFNEIIRFKHQKTEFAAGFSTAIVSDSSADAAVESSVEALGKRLLELLELQAAEAKWMGGEAGARYPDAQYAMAALADELFSQEGDGPWPAHHLEGKLFKTHSSELELFKRIDRLLKEQPNSQVARDLGRVYLLVLAAGYRGKYRQFGLTRVLAEYRQRLYEYVHRDDALLLYATDRRIFPDANSHTLEGQAVSRFTAAQRWTAILIFIVVSYAVAAHLAWDRVSDDLDDVTGRIRAASTDTGVQ